MSLRASQEPEARGGGGAYPAMTRWSGEPGRTRQNVVSYDRTSVVERRRSSCASAPLYHSGIPIELTPADPVHNARKLWASHNQSACGPAGDVPL